MDTDLRVSVSNMDEQDDFGATSPLGSQHSAASHASSSFSWTGTGGGARRSSHKSDASQIRSASVRTGTSMSSAALRKRGSMEASSPRTEAFGRAGSVRSVRSSHSVAGSAPSSVRSARSVKSAPARPKTPGSASTTSKTRRLPVPLSRTTSHPPAGSSSSSRPGSRAGSTRAGAGVGAGAGAGTGPGGANILTRPPGSIFSRTGSVRSTRSMMATSASVKTAPLRRTTSLAHRPSSRSSRVSPSPSTSLVTRKPRPRSHSLSSLNRTSQSPAPSLSRAKTPTRISRQNSVASSTAASTRSRKSALSPASKQASKLPSRMPHELSRSQSLPAKKMARPARQSSIGDRSTRARRSSVSSERSVSMSLPGTPERRWLHGLPPKSPKNPKDSLGALASERRGMLSRASSTMSLSRSPSASRGRSKTPTSTTGFGRGRSYSVDQGDGLLHKRASSPGGSTASKFLRSSSASPEKKGRRRSLSRTRSDASASDHRYREGAGEGGGAKEGRKTFSRSGSAESHHSAKTPLSLGGRGRESGGSSPGSTSTSRGGGARGMASQIAAALNELGLVGSPNSFQGAGAGAGVRHAAERTEEWSGSSEDEGSRGGEGHGGAGRRGRDLSRRGYAGAEAGRFESREDELDALRREHKRLLYDGVVGGEASERTKELGLALGVESARCRQLANEAFELRAAMEGAKKEAEGAKEELENERHRGKREREEMERLRDELEAARADAERSRIEGGRSERVQLDAVHGTLSRLRSELKRVMEEREAVLDERERLVIEKADAEERLEALARVHRHEVEMMSEGHRMSSSRQQGEAEKQAAECRRLEQEAMRLQGVVDAAREEAGCLKDEVGKLKGEVEAHAARRGCKMCDAAEVRVREAEKRSGEAERGRERAERGMASSRRDLDMAMQELQDVEQFLVAEVEGRDAVIASMQQGHLLNAAHNPGVGGGHSVSASGARHAAPSFASPTPPSRTPSSKGGGAYAIYSSLRTPAHVRDRLQGFFAGESARGAQQNHQAAPDRSAPLAMHTQMQSASPSKEGLPAPLPPLGEGGLGTRHSGDMVGSAEPRAVRGTPLSSSNAASAVEGTPNASSNATPPYPSTSVVKARAAAWGDVGESPPGARMHDDQADARAAALRGDDSWSEEGSFDEGGVEARGRVMRALHKAGATPATIRQVSSAVDGATSRRTTSSDSPAQAQRPPPHPASPPPSSRLQEFSIHTNTTGRVDDGDAPLSLSPSFQKLTSHLEGIKSSESSQSGREEDRDAHFKALSEALEEISQQRKARNSRGSSLATSPLPKSPVP